MTKILLVKTQGGDLIGYGSADQEKIARLKVGEIFEAVKWNDPLEVVGQGNHEERILKAIARDIR
jgi:hypothetical protein